MIRVSLSRLLREQFSLPAELSTEPLVREHFLHNVLVNFGDIIAWLFGISFMAYNTILPVYASTITSSPLVIGLIPAFTESGWFLPQLLLVSWVERMPRRIAVIRWLTIFERLPFLCMALLAFWQNKLLTSTLVSSFIFLVAIRAFMAGIVALPYQEMIATVIPITHRGRFFGFSHAIGGLVSVLGSMIAAVILNRLAYPRNYAVIFFIGFLFIMLSYIFLIMTREPRNRTIAPEGLGWSQTLQRFSTLLRINQNFRWFLFSRGLTFMGNMALGFLAVYAVRRFQLPDAQAAIFTGVMMTSNTIGYAIWGRVADQWGYKRLAIIAALLWLGALVLALLAPSGIFFYLVFVLYGLSNGSGVMADFNIAMEFGSEADRPAYIGLTRTLTGPVLLVAPLLGGWLVELVGYPAMFFISLGFASLGLLTLWRYVIEPRQIENHVNEYSEWRVTDANG